MSTIQHRTTEELRRSVVGRQFICIRTREVLDVDTAVIMNNISDGLPAFALSPAGWTSLVEQYRADGKPIHEWLATVDFAVQADTLPEHEHNWITERDGVIDGVPAFVSHCDFCNATTPRHHETRKA